jgi:hypothetical protein
VKRGESGVSVVEASDVQTLALLRDMKLWGHRKCHWEAVETRGLCLHFSNHLISVKCEIHRSICKAFRSLCKSLGTQLSPQIELLFQSYTILGNPVPFVSAQFPILWNKGNCAHLSRVF